jgi:hypothetical protein
MSEEDRSLAEAIRLSMLDDLSEEAATGADSAVDVLSSRLATQTLQPSPPAPPPAPALRASADAAASAAAKAPTARAAAEDHLPAGWESALAAEPPTGAAGSTRVQLRLASGKTVVRRFLLTDSVASLFAACVELMPEARHTPFALQTPIATEAKTRALKGHNRTTTRTAFLLTNYRGVFQ